MANTDWGGLIGTVFMGGVALKMTERMFPEKEHKQEERHERKERANKKKKAGVNSVNYPRFNSPF